MGQEVQEVQEAHQTMVHSSSQRCSSSTICKSKKIWLGINHQTENHSSQALPVAVPNLEACLCIEKRSRNAMK